MAADEDVALGGEVAAIVVKQMAAAERKEAEVLLKRRLWMKWLRGGCC